jgi:hypothetical protein
MVSTHRFLFPVDPSVTCKLFRTSSICLVMTVEDAESPVMTVEDAESPGEVERSEGGEGELNVTMGERKKKDGVTLASICAFNRMVRDTDRVRVHNQAWRANC